MMLDALTKNEDDRRLVADITADPDVIDRWGINGLLV